MSRLEFHRVSRAPRWNTGGADIVVLGTFGEFDLYFADQEHLPPTLVARYGDGGGEYLSANPSLLSEAQIEQLHPALQEAFHRLIPLLGEW